MQPSRHHGQAPRDSLLHPVWEPVVEGQPSTEAFVARCLLGAGWVAGKRKLSMFDLRVWAALLGQLGAQLPAELPADDLTLANADTRTVETTGYQLVERVCGDDGGEKYRQIRRSLGRLQGATITIRTVYVDPELAAERISEGSVSLIGDIWAATTRLDLTTPREWGALKASTSLKVEVGRWPAQQVHAGRCTWLDLDLLRALGPGLASRVWAGLEAWARWPQESFDGRQETAIGLGTPALESLGVAGYARPIDARRALDRAGRRIVATDPAYELVRCERRAGWCLIVRRLSGPRARANARQGAAWRSSGTAANKQQRAERSALRSQIRASLTSADSAAHSTKP